LPRRGRETAQWDPRSGGLRYLALNDSPNGKISSTRASAEYACDAADQHKKRPEDREVTRK